MMYNSFLIDLSFDFFVCLFGACWDPVDDETKGWPRDPHLTCTAAAAVPAYACCLCLFPNYTFWRESVLK